MESVENAIKNSIVFHKFFQISGYLFSTSELEDPFSNGINYGYVLEIIVFDSINKTKKLREIVRHYTIVCISLLESVM